MSTRNGIGTSVRWGLLAAGMGFVVVLAGMSRPAVAGDVFSACSKNTTNKLRASSILVNVLADAAATADLRRALP